MLGYRFAAGLKGSNIIRVGADTDIFNFSTIQEAVDVAKKGDLILVEPGTYTLTTALTVDNEVTIKGVGATGGVIVTSALTTRTVLVKQPAAAVGAATVIKFENISFINSSTGNALEIDTNGGADLPMYVDIYKCNITNTSTGYAIYSKKTTDVLLYINIAGSGAHLLGKSYFTEAKAADEVNIFNMYCTGAFTLDAGAVASVFNMMNCLYTSTAQTTGGGAGKLLNYCGNIYGASGPAGALTKGVNTDFDATGTELFVTYA